MWPAKNVPFVSKMNKTPANAGVLFNESINPEYDNQTLDIINKICYCTASRTNSSSKLIWISTGVINLLVIPESFWALACPYVITFSASWLVITYEVLVYFGILSGTR